MLKEYKTFVYQCDRCGVNSDNQNGFEAVLPPSWSQTIGENNAIVATTCPNCPAIPYTSVPRAMPPSMVVIPTEHFQSQVIPPA